MDDLIVHHRLACDGFTAVADAVPPDRWSAASPCTESDARAVVEHVIGFHEFLLLRPLGVRAHRPRDDAAARWRATADALFAFLARNDSLDRPAELPGGGRQTARVMLGALTTDVLVHTWDLARAAGIDVVLEPELSAAAYESARRTEMDRTSGLVGPEVPVAPDADTASKLLARYGRDPSWEPNPTY